MLTVICKGETENVIKLELYRELSLFVRVYLITQFESLEVKFVSEVVTAAPLFIIYFGS